MLTDWDGCEVLVDWELCEVPTELWEMAALGAEMAEIG
jgi:hypothetical protein